METFEYLVVGTPSAGILDVQLTRPPANAVDQQMYTEIAALFSQPDRISSSIKTIVLSGAGRHFCAGNDLNEFATMTPDNGTERMWRVREAFFAIQDCPVPVIAAVHGAALGTGLVIAASCDVIVAARDARFGLPELTVGVMGGARHLARWASQPLVRRMFFTGESLSAEELAKASAGALIICEREDLLGRAHAIAARVASLSPTAVRLGKRILNHIEFMDLKSGYEFEQKYTVQMSGHADAKEALTAFREKRPARFEPLSELRRMPDPGA